MYREQEYAPLLFAVQPLDQATPRAATPLRADSSLSTQRRSVTQTPGSMATDATPAPPPPIMRLYEDVVMEDPGSAARGGGVTPPGRQTPQQQAHGGATPTPPPPQPSTSGGLGFEQQQPNYDDVWVTVYGFSQQEVPLVLKEFHRCGDIISWGFGEPHSNFIHIQARGAAAWAGRGRCFQNKHGAQRALIRNGEQLTGSLIIGVKPLDPRHRLRVASLQDGPDSPATAYRPKPVPERPYRVEATAGQRVPQPSRSVLTRVYEFVLGM
ncbi:Nucleoporin NUP53 [Tetrabaena socialis]|uniref:Nucleoporin NUP53 n=1 Tax=Tetrabaena socialis TaxID=47790 RepID=A0A2J8A7I2_9CHLO|nr:Nucleoporin NUP53 [Tetrabaena socialis]|eukprot:PNH08433.1 Nucleoporin NUP53 [Tetrabaena socialis]